MVQIKTCDMPIIEGLGKYSRRYEESPNLKYNNEKSKTVILREDANYGFLVKNYRDIIKIYPKDNLHHPTTKRKLFYREGRKAKNNLSELL